MLMIEVFHAAREAISTEQKQAFAQDVIGIGKAVLYATIYRSRLFFHQLNWEDCLPGLLPESINYTSSSTVLKVHIQIGASDEQKAVLIDHLISAAQSCLGVPGEQVVVIIYEIPKANYFMKGL